MDANEFNKLIDNYAKKVLIPLGFKKKGVHYYLHRDSRILVFYKNSFRGFFANFYLAMTYDFLSNTFDKKGKLKPPPYLEDYPVSISLHCLQQQFKKFKKVTDFSACLNFTVREVAVTRHLYRNESMIIFESLPENKEAKTYIKKCIDIMTSDGLKFAKQYKPQICLDTLSKYKSDDSTITEFQLEIKEFLKQ